MLHVYVCDNSCLLPVSLASYLFPHKEESITSHELSEPSQWGKAMT